MNGNWKRRIRRDREGRPLTDADNLAFILESDPRLHGTVRRNEFSGMIEREKDLPFNPLSKLWTDECESLLRYLAKEYGISKCAKELANAVEAVVSARRYHPVREYLSSLPKWDGQRRVSTMLMDYLGAEGTPIAEACRRDG